MDQMTTRVEDVPRHFAQTVDHLDIGDEPGGRHPLAHGSTERRLQ